MNNEKVFAFTFASIYALYVNKVERKGRTRAELDAVLCWLTGHTAPSLQAEIDSTHDLRTFFATAPRLHPDCHLIKGMICGYRIEEITDPLMQRIRQMDKLVDELAKGRAVEKIMRG